jgi:P27 family predicted phage terminase small subunit
VEARTFFCRVLAFLGAKLGKRGPKSKAGRATAEPSRPYAPRGLDDDAKSAWDSLCDDLESAGTLDKTDRHLILLYVRTYVLWVKVDAELTAQCEAMLGQSFPIVARSQTELESQPADDEGPEFPHKLAKLHLSLTARLRQILLDCGLSPSTRPARQESPGGFWDSLIGGGRDGGI